MMRRQLVNAVKGLDDVYTATQERPRTSFAASISVDMSGSMGEHIQKMELYDAVLVLGDTFGLLDVPHEVRAFGSLTAQVKAIAPAVCGPPKGWAFSRPIFRHGSFELRCWRWRPFPAR